MELIFPILMGLVLLVVAMGTRVGRGGLGRYGIGNDRLEPWVDSPAALPLPAVPRFPAKEASAARIEAVKQRLGELRTDLIWVIEHPSLFDGATPESALMFEKLAAWGDESRYLSDREAHNLAGAVEDAFTSARRAAEALGLDFYDEPGRQEADVAVKLVAKARSTSGAEARLLMDKVAEILARLLPFDVPEAITAARESDEPGVQAP